jgi:hypothetical protein
MLTYEAIKSPWDWLVALGGIFTVSDWRKSRHLKNVDLAGQRDIIAFVSPISGMLVGNG